MSNNRKTNRRNPSKGKVLELNPDNQTPSDQSEGSPAIKEAKKPRIELPNGHALNDPSFSENATYTSMFTLYIVEAILQSGMQGMKQVLENSQGSSVNDLLSQTSNLRGMMRSIVLPIFSLTNWIEMGDYVPGDRVDKLVKDTCIAQGRLLFNFSKSFGLSAGVVYSAPGMIKDAAEQFSKEDQYDQKPSAQIFDSFRALKNASEDELLEGVLGPRGAKMAEKVTEMDGGSLEPALHGKGTMDLPPDHPMREAMHLSLTMDLPMLNIAEIVYRTLVKGLDEADLDGSQKAVEAKFAGYSAAVQLCRFAALSPDATKEEMTQALVQDTASKHGLAAALWTSSNLKIGGPDQAMPSQKEISEESEKHLNEMITKVSDLLESISVENDKGETESIGTKLVHEFIGTDWKDQILPLARKRANDAIQNGVENAFHSSTP